MATRQNNGGGLILLGITLLLVAFKKPKKNPLIIDNPTDEPVKGYKFLVYVKPYSNYYDTAYNIVGINGENKIKLSAKPYPKDNDLLIVLLANNEYLVDKLDTIKI